MQSQKVTAAYFSITLVSQNVASMQAHNNSVADEDEMEEVELKFLRACEQMKREVSDQSKQIQNWIRHKRH
jgi:hypothetical protein